MSHDDHPCKHVEVIIAAGPAEYGDMQHVIRDCLIYCASTHCKYKVSNSSDQFVKLGRYIPAIICDRRHCKTE